LRPIDASAADDGLSGPADDPLAQLDLEVGGNGAGDDVLQRFDHLFLNLKQPFFNLRNILFKKYNHFYL
jgi:hypothetical protein